MQFKEVDMDQPVRDLISKVGFKKSAGEVRIGEHKPDLMAWNETTGKTWCIEYIAKKAVDRNHFRKAYAYKDIANFMAIAFLTGGPAGKHDDIDQHLDWLLATAMKIMLIEVNQDTGLASYTWNLEVIGTKPSSSIHTESIKRIEETLAMGKDQPGGQAKNAAKTRSAHELDMAKEWLDHYCKDAGLRGTVLADHPALMKIFKYAAPVTIYRWMKDDINKRFRGNKVNGRLYVGLALED